MAALSTQNRENEQHPAFPLYRQHIDGLSGEAVIGFDNWLAIYKQAARVGAAERFPDNPLIPLLIERDFFEEHTGGGCIAFHRFHDGKSQVVTSCDGCAVPEVDDWLWCQYDRHWHDEEAKEVDVVDVDAPPCDLITFLDMANV